MTTKMNYSLTPHELELIGELGGCEIKPLIPEDENINDEERQNMLSHMPKPEDLKHKMVALLLEEGPCTFADFAHTFEMPITEIAALDNSVIDVLIACYKMGVTDECAACANNLGALYYWGDLVEQDFHKAAELYELAMQWGSYQSVINLGYIYEYGRTGKKDYKKAYRFYSLAAALEPSCEALYKLGDMYAKGRLFPADIRSAHALWEKAFDESDNIEEEAQAAIRIAPLLLDPDNKELGIEFDPIQALCLYQKAEIGLRLSIKKGMHYYKKRLKEALEGQINARSMIEMFDLI